MLSPEQATKGGGMVACPEWLSVHDTIHQIVVLHHNGQFAVV